MICIAIDNGSDNTVGGSYYSAHQAVGKFEEHHVDMVSCVHRKCQTQNGKGLPQNGRGLGFSFETSHNSKMCNDKEVLRINC